MYLLLDIALFLGRFHPLVVHLPIGFLFFAAILEFIAWKKALDLHFAIRCALLLGALSAVVATIFGWLLAQGGGYQESSLSWHKWLGIATAGVAMIIYWLKHRTIDQSSANLYRAVVLAMILLLTLTGHFGGTLTHGSTYLLEYAPTPMRQLAGMTPARERLTSFEEALAYEDAVQYIFNEKCTACHNDDKAKGDLILTDAQAVQAGGENGPVLVAGQASESEIYRRVTLDPNHDDFMPSEGRMPMTKAEVSILKWWINEGAPLETKISTISTPDPIRKYLEEIGIGIQPSFLATLSLPAISDEQTTVLASQAFDVRPIVAGSMLLEVSIQSGDEASGLKDLLVVKQHVVWLELSGVKLGAEGLDIIGQLPNLVRLKLDRTDLNDDHLSSLSGLQHLEYLNLYGTRITDSSIPTLSQLPALQKVYVWDTGLTEDGITKLRELRPDLEVVSGYKTLARGATADGT